MTERPSDQFNRRTLIAGAALGAVALASAPASAQRCPAVPPPRTKGPLVWLDLDQHELDEAYDQSVYAFNQQHITDRRNERNEVALKVLGKPDRVAYGAAEIERVDIYKTRRANAPVMIYLHGGAWRNGRSALNAYLAEPFVKAGANFINVEFNNVGEVDGDIGVMVDQCRRAVAWVHRNATSFGDSNALYLSGHSSGGHLAGCVVITEWEKLSLPRDILKGALLGSGMYDLKPARLSARSSYVKFTDAVEQALSAQRHIDKLHTPLVLVHGTLETPEFQRQSRDFHAAVRAAGKPATLIVAKGHNHFELGESLGNPYGIMGRAAFEMMKLTTGA